jgi:hypothetical protein
VSFLLHFSVWLLHCSPSCFFANHGILFTALGVTSFSAALFLIPPCLGRESSTPHCLFAWTFPLFRSPSDPDMTARFPFLTAL